LSPFFLRFTAPFHRPMPIGSTECQLPLALPIRLRLGGHLWYRFG
jgi:hypothetical protein